MPGPVFRDGERVELRTIEEADLDFLQSGVNDPSVWRSIGALTPTNGPQEREFFENVVCDESSVNLLVTVDGAPAGTVGLTPRDAEPDGAELGYWLDSEFRGNGYGQEAAGLVTNYGFRQQGYHRISARVFAFNDASQNLLESLGFRHEGTHRDAAFVDGEHWDVHWYSVLEDEWDASEW
jgi:ribosomal-protein-alanine N-acetyltransferase